MARPTPTSAAAMAMTNRANTCPAIALFMAREGDQVDVDGVEDQLDRHEHGTPLRRAMHAVDADAEQDGAEQEELVEQHAPTPSARATMAPMRAASSSTDTTSNGIR